MKPIIILSLHVVLAGCTANARFDLSGKPTDQPPASAASSPQAQPAQHDVMGWSAQKPASAGELDQEVIVVRDGDTLYSLAKRHGVTVDMIYAANGLRNEHLTPGQHLIVPRAQKAPDLLASEPPPY